MGVARIFLFLLSNVTYVIWITDWDWAMYSNLISHKLLSSVRL